MKKRCLKCGAIKPKKSFYKNKRARSGQLSACINCYRAYQRAYCVAHTDRVYKWRLSYVALHREEIRAHNRDYARRHSKHRREVSRLHYQNNKLAYRDRNKLYREEHKERLATASKVWKINNKDKVRDQQRRRRVAIYNASGSHTEEEWLLLKKKYNFKCAICGIKEQKLRALYKLRAFQQLTEDHIIPLSLRGSDGIWNIQPLCQSCNSRKNNKIECNS